MALSTQEIFDRAAEHLIKQDAIAMDDTNWTCAYLNGKGQRCAIGIFLPDGHEAQQSNKIIYTLLIDYPDLEEILGSYNDKERLQFLRDLQNVHDRHETSGLSWYAALKTFAYSYKLDQSKLNSLVSEKV